MPMLTNAWKANQTATPDATSMPNMSSATAAALIARKTMMPSSADDHRAADEAELLPRDREDEVGLHRGDEVAAGERAVEQALAEQRRRSRPRSSPAARCSPRRPGPAPGAGTRSAGSAGSPFSRCSLADRVDGRGRADQQAEHPVQPDAGHARSCAASVKTRTSMTPRAGSRSTRTISGAAARTARPASRRPAGRPRLRRLDARGGTGSRRCPGSARAWRTPTARPGTRRAARSRPSPR